MEEKIITVNKNTPADEAKATMSMKDRVIVANETAKENNTVKTAEEKTTSANEVAVTTNSNMPTVSIIVAVTEIDILVKHIGSIAAQDYANIEVILVNNDKNKDYEVKLHRLIRKYHGKCSIKILQFERTHGYGFEPIAANELYIAGADQASGDYLLFMEDNINYNSTYISRAVTKLQNEKADFAFTDLVITWKDETSYRYIHEIDVDGDIFGSYIKNAGKLFGLSNSETKLISRELWKKVKSDFVAHYENDKNHAALYAGELILADLLWSNAVKAVYVPEIFAIVNWGEVDAKISTYGEERKSDRIVSEIYEALNYTSDICVKKNISMVDYERYAAEFLSRLMWRIDWVNSSIKSKSEATFGLSVPEYSIVNAFAGRIFTIDLSEYEAQYDSSSSESDMKIKIFISMHKPSFIPENNKYLFPIQNGSIYAEERFSNTLHDDEGENISSKKEMYCELSDQYWAWKNCHDADYYGFWHYRRYFSFNENEQEDIWGVIQKDVLNNDTLSESYIDEKHIADICNNYDIIVPNAWSCMNKDGKKMTVYEHWCNYFNKEDMDITVKVILNKYPQYYSAVMDVLHSNHMIFCNMFIMKKELFEEYSAFCFDVLEEVETLIDQKRYNVEEYRTLGHIGERILAFYVRYIEITRPEVYICHLGRTQYKDTRPIAKVNRPNKDNCVSVMLACSNEYMKYTDVLLQSIYENTNDDFFYDIVICHRGITEANQQISKDIFAAKDNILLRFVDVTRNFEKYDNLHIDRQFAYETYYRLLVMDIFEEYDRVLYLDCDMIVNADISQLFNTEMNDEYVAAVRDYDFISSCVKQKEFFQENILKYIKIDDYFNYFQAGMILFNLKTMREHFTTDTFFRVAQSRNWWFFDQDILNCMFNGHVKYVDDKWNVFSLLDKGSPREHLINDVLAANFAESYKRSAKNPAIIHYAGVPKVWNSEVNLGYIFWKYARKSPSYELLLQNLINGEGVKNDWLVFFSEPENENSGVKFFTIKPVNENWISSYFVIDFMFFNRDNTVETDTLTVSVTLYPHDINGSWADVKQFNWKKKDSLFKDNVMFMVNENHNIDIYVRCTDRYTGYSFAVHTLESREMIKPAIEVCNHKIIKEIETLPDQLNKGWE